MIDASGCDALFVVNHQTPVAAIAARVRARGYRRVFVLGTQFFFAHERTALTEALTPAEVALGTFADLFTDAELAACDEATSAQLLARPPRWALYSEEFEVAAARRKNALALAALRRAGLPTGARLYATEGLGVALATWRAAGAEELPPPRSWRYRLRQSVPGRVRAGIKATRQAPPPTALRLREGGTEYLFAGTLRRLGLAAGVSPEEVPWAEALAQPHPARFVAAGLHDYSPALHRIGPPVRLFVDGFLPPNYPRTYLDTFACAGFVCVDPISARWLERFGRPLAPVPRFLATGEFAPAPAPAALRTVVVFLQHAGNWTSLIHRSDNDALVAAALELAAAAPDLRLILRAHPSMENPRHEGAGARARLAAAVAAAGRPNVEFSTTSLAEDLARGDLCIAEYSAALLEAWRAGQPGLAVNVTPRRSFMQDFADLGFAHATGVADFVRTVAALRADPAAGAARQSAAAARYNALLRAHLGRFSPLPP